MNSPTPWSEPFPPLPSPPAQRGEVWLIPPPGRATELSDLRAHLEAQGWTVQIWDAEPPPRPSGALELYWNRLPDPAAPFLGRGPLVVCRDPHPTDGETATLDLLEQGVAEVLDSGASPVQIGQALSQAQARGSALQKRHRVLERALAQLPGNLSVYSLESSAPLLSNTPQQPELAHRFLEAALQDAPIPLVGYHPDGTPYHRDEWPLIRSMRHSETVQGERVEVEEHGERRILSISSTPLPLLEPSGDTTRVQAVSVYTEDLTESLLSQQALERNLQQSESRYRVLVETAHEGIWQLDAQDNTVYVNPRMCELLGYEAEALLGQPIWNFLHPDELAERPRCPQELRPGEREQVELRFLTREGRLLWVLGSTTALTDAQGNYSGSFGLFADITDRKRAEQLLLEREIRMHEVLERQHRFAADASHELRAPLTAIQGNLELLRRFPNMSPEDHRAALHEAEQEANHLSRLVGDLLTLARADAGIQIRKAPLALERVVGETFTQVRFLARGQHLHLDALEAVQVLGDPDRVRQLLFILLENAVKYTPSGGEVRLALKSTPQGAHLSVRDTGPGISRRDLPHVFERFYRADPARGRFDPGGTGLGLSLAQWIVQGHGGHIWLESEEGQGTVAHVRLPLAGGG